MPSEQTEGAPPEQTAGLSERLSRLIDTYEKALEEARVSLEAADELAARVEKCGEVREYRPDLNERGPLVEHPINDAQTACAAYRSTRTTKGEDAG